MPASQVSYVSGPSTITSVRGVRSWKRSAMHDQSLPPVIATRKPAFSSAFHSRNVAGSSSGIRSIDRKSSRPRTAWTIVSQGVQQPPGRFWIPSAGQNWA
jgi:hypothetical protein